jgi:hypothetical protein
VISPKNRRAGRPRISESTSAAKQSKVDYSSKAKIRNVCDFLAAKNTVVPRRRRCPAALLQLLHAATLRARAAATCVAARARERAAMVAEVPRHPPNPVLVSLPRYGS